ncbi:hypothetical protein COJ85_20555 [Bacillus sp. AFS076308]|uniref:hypothetical protein n=2 Tax=unclassified Bacillus (in: firmicutes) TaxID=185979 RepID=UPI000BF33BF5|nr:hypothetical protein [Bacillus sp. AFS037270]PFN98764.1 hypothetical protein COJ85_20555 [Bacillus sp. AFS076308]PGV53458.1 hypothetical protein COD92_07700 [Bacillus sp. AFS037270]
MQKKKFTSWGVSFASLALVAGMMSYMGIKKDTTTNTTAVATTQNSTQSSQSGSTEDSSITYEVPSQSTDTTGSTNTSGTTDTSGTGQSDNQSVSQDNSFPSQHGGFDTTTGGT